MTTLAISVGIADVHRDPDSSSERVTQALLNVPVLVEENIGDWLRVQLPDYKGWIRSDEAAEPVTKGFCKVGTHCLTPLDLVAVVTVPQTSLLMDAVGDDTLDNVFLSTILPLLDTTHPERLQVALPGGCMAWLSRSTAVIRQMKDAFPIASVDVVTSYARHFLNVPYLWGGTSGLGIDCSGLVQLCYRMAGYPLPRDADEQEAALISTIQRKDLREGDLIFFGSEQITHVALALNQFEYIHAEGQHYNRVVINSFEATAAHYNRRLDEIVWTMKRVVL